MPAKSGGAEGHPEQLHGASSGRGGWGGRPLSAESFWSAAVRVLVRDDHRRRLRAREGSPAMPRYTATIAA